MKNFHSTTCFALGIFMFLVLGISSLHTTQTELTLLCDKFNEDITLPESQQCVNPVSKSRNAITFINRQGNILIYEYIRMDPTKRIVPKTRVWFDFMSIRPNKGCDAPTILDKWRMVVWMTPNEKICYYPE